MSMEYIHIPTPPRSWDELTDEQMEVLNAFHKIYNASNEQFLLSAFLYLAKLMIDPDTDMNDSLGENTFVLRQRDEDGKPFGSPIKFTAEEAAQYVELCVSWLNGDCNRLMPTFQEVEVDGIKFNSTGYAMAGMTYQQYQFASRYLGMYHTETMNLVNLYDKLTHVNPKSNEAAKLVEQAESMNNRRNGYRNSFLATVYTPVTLITSKMVDGKQVHYDPPIEDYVFTAEQVNRNAKRFALYPDERAEAVMQHFMGTLFHYKKLYPLLFKSGEDSEVPDPIKVEESTMNALQGKLNFSNYQTIYDSNAPFILGKLHAIIQEAKDIEEYNLKLKAKNY